MANARWAVIVFGAIVLPIIIIMTTLRATLGMLGLSSFLLLISAGCILGAVFLILIVSRRGNLYFSGEEIQAPISLKNKLDDGEVMVSRLTGQLDVDWVLTNKHLIRLQKNDPLKSVEKPLWLLPMQGLTAQYKTRSTARKITFWSLCAMLSIVGIVMATLGYLGTINPAYSFSWGIWHDAALILGLAGFISLFIAVLLPATNYSYYQFLHPSLEAGTDKKLWRLRETSKNKEPLKKFLNDIQRHSQTP